METVCYDKNNPFLASIKERYALSKSGSKKNTQHLVLDLRGSGLTYRVGDSIGVFPRHEPELISQTLHALKASGDEMVQIQTTGERVTLAQFLATKANITEVSPKLFREVLARQSDEAKKGARRFKAGS